jgi:hypothetical protein
MAEIWVKGNSDFDRLTDSEKLRLTGGLVVVFKVFEEAYERKQEAHYPRRHGTQSTDNMLRSWPLPSISGYGKCAATIFMKTFKSTSTSWSQARGRYRDPSSKVTIGSLETSLGVR